MWVDVVNITVIGNKKQEINGEAVGSCKIIEEIVILLPLFRLHYLLGALSNW